MNIGIVGAGLIGNKRAQSISGHSKDQIVAVADIDIDKARELGEKLGCIYFSDPKKIFSDPKIDVVLVCTINKYLAPLTLAALKSGKHVLCEKPLGANSKEINKCVLQAKKRQLIYKAGYNHRFHPAIFTAHKLVRAGKIGKLMFIKASYGHGARPGYDKEWRAQKSLSGGGELLDQGCHIIDLVHWFTGKKATKIATSLSAKFWPIKPLEDNAFVTLELGEVTASFHTSWTQWKNEFIFELYGKKGYIKINGLGGSYGKETLTFAKGAPGYKPTEKVTYFEGSDNSWTEEWKNFKKAIKNRRDLLSSGEEGLEVMKVIDKIYNTK